VDSADLISRGDSLSRKIHKDKFPKIRNKIGDICPDLGYLMIAEGYGHVLSRDGLDLKSRELAVVASLISLKAHRQLHSHIRGARNVGCHDLEIYEAIITGVIWVKPGKIRKAVKLWSEITGRESPDSIDKNIYSRV
jgi:4-carboxymuconolactone decarboxylase